MQSLHIWYSANDHPCLATRFIHCSFSRLNRMFSSLFLPHMSHIIIFSPFSYRIARGRSLCTRKAHYNPHKIRLPCRYPLRHLLAISHCVSGALSCGIPHSNVLVTNVASGAAGSRTRVRSETVSSLTAPPSLQPVLFREVCLAREPAEEKEHHHRKQNPYYR